MDETQTPTRHYYEGNGQRYEAAKRQVEETQGNLWTERDRWRLAVFLLLGLVAVLIGGLVHVGRQPAYTPIYLKVNAEGQLSVMGWDAYEPSVEELKADLLMWMRCVRGIPLDRPVLERCWRLVPLFLLDGTPAKAQVKAWFDQVKPDQALFHKSIDIRHMKAFTHPDGRWQVSWQQDVYELPRSGGLGKLVMSSAEEAILIVTRRQPTTRAHIELDGEPVNPRGLYITHLSWN